MNWSVQNEVSKMIATPLADAETEIAPESLDAKSQLLVARTVEPGSTPRSVAVGFWIWPTHLSIALQHLDRHHLRAKYFPK